MTGCRLLRGSLGTCCAGEWRGTTASLAQQHPLELACKLRFNPCMTTLLVATRNSHKVNEIRAILGNDFQCLTLNEFAASPQVVEDADTFEGNAMKKAVELAHWLAENPQGTSDFRMPMFLLADDSGLEVDALNGAPGVHSARFAALDAPASLLAGNSSDADNLNKLLSLLKGVPAEYRTARFRCVIALVPVPFDVIESASPVCYASEKFAKSATFDGVCEGRIGFESRGRNGFGYDPVFVPEGFNETFAELGDSVKNRLSHRGRALAKLKEYFR